MLLRRHNNKVEKQNTSEGKKTTKVDSKKNTSEGKKK
jgi:hypothetical protein